MYFLKNSFTFYHVMTWQEIRSRCYYYEPLKGCQNWVSNTLDIADMDKWQQDKCVWSNVTLTSVLYCQEWMGNSLLNSFSNGPDDVGRWQRATFFFFFFFSSPGDLYWIGSDKSCSTLIGQHKLGVVQMHEVLMITLRLRTASSLCCSTWLSNFAAALIIILVAHFTL